jgi:NitT/TauT family transport system substrate-binding protein
MKEGTTLESVQFSSKTADAFNLKYKVYAKPQDVKSYFDPSILMELSKEMK